MKSLTAWFKTVVIGHRRNLTAGQENGAACVLCGHEFRSAEESASYGWRGPIPGIHRVHACRFACTLEVVDDVEALFRSAIPARQDVWTWHVGVDDNPLTTAPDGGDMFDQAYADALEAGPKRTVEIVHPGGILTTRPIPVVYAEKISEQAMRLGYTAMIDEGATAR
jgi:hypothetical protein